ncbi:MAG: 4-hydroxythreonine-4-phosphate dehydrogenase PdxA, partial [Candidatus Omnitrophica bacterium]|nr:4-hydroxythreonine-4-phosphate dehydrogenase PdxA [Candidatus Omnitrophota bacterium]
MIKSKYKVKIGITMGDPSGIGPAVTLKSVERLKGVAELVIIGDAWVLSKIRGHKVTSASIIDLANVARKNFVFGKVSAEYGRASLDYLGRALQMLKEKKIDCLVTSPVSKEA